MIFSLETIKVSYLQYLICYTQKVYLFQSFHIISLSSLRNCSKRVSSWRNEQGVKNVVLADSDAANGLLEAGRRRTHAGQGVMRILVAM